MIQFTGGEENTEAVIRFAGSIPHARVVWNEGTDRQRNSLVFYTRHGRVTVATGEWIAKGADGDVYLAKPGMRASRAS
jgi:hypothetical protein